jgi:hypothetical protein
MQQVAKTAECSTHGHAKTHFSAALLTAVKATRLADANIFVELCRLHVVL